VKSEIQECEQVERLDRTEYHNGIPWGLKVVSESSYDALLAYTKELQKQLEAKYNDGFADGYDKARDEGGEL
jgi:hypothetical protein